MKNLLLIFALITSVILNAQDLETVIRNEVQPNSSVETLKAAEVKIDSLCNIKAMDKCKKAKATTLYLIANKYYHAVMTVADVDPNLAKPILNDAQKYYSQAQAIMPLSDYDFRQLSLIAPSIQNFQKNSQYKLLLEN